MSQARIHTSPSLVKLTQIFTKILYSPCLLGHPLPAVTLTNLIPKANEYYEPKYICHQNFVKLLQWFVRCGVYKVFSMSRALHMSHDVLPNFG